MMKCNPIINLEQSSPNISAEDSCSVLSNNMRTVDPGSMLNVFDRSTSNKAMEMRRWANMKR